HGLYPLQNPFGPVLPIAELKGALLRLGRQRMGVLSFQSDLPLRAMTEAMRDALELIRSLKEQYPEETEDQLISRFHKELEGDQALRRALMRDVFKHLLQE